MGKRIYLILGASSDIGLKLIENLTNNCSQESVIIAHYFKNKEKLESIKSRNDGTLIDIKQADFTSKEQLHDLINYVMETYGEVTDIIHLPADKFSYMKVKQLNWELIEKGMEIQVHSLAEILKAFLPGMVKQKQGKVVVLLTAYTLGNPPKNMIDYIVLKYALLGLLKGAAVEYGEKGININGISPGMMETKFLDNLDPRIIEMNANNNLIKRNVKVEETVEGIQFLLSPASDCMVGVNLNMSGGIYM